MSSSNSTTTAPTEPTTQPAPTTATTPPATTATTPPPPPPSSSSSSEPPPPPPATTPTTAPTTNPPPTTATTPPPQQSSSFITTTKVITPTVPGGQPSTITEIQTQTLPPQNSSPTSGGGSGTGLPGSPNNNNNPNGDGSTDGTAKTIAVATVVPIVVVALLVLGGLFFWRKRKQRKAAEEERRKEVEEYGFNPNADAPSAPEMGAAGAGGYEDASSGYRGWGSTTLAGSTGRKASTTMSGGAPPVAYSDGTAASPTHANASDTRSAEPLMHGHGDGSVSPEGEILGAMGPSAAANRGGDVRRGPSNASSSYSAAARSDGSGDAVGMAYGGDARYYDGYGNNPYSDAYGASPPRAGENGGASSPIIKDNPARRNTRIENSGHYPQQAGISQNF